MVTELTDATIEEFIKKNKVAAVDCWAPWCGPCRRMGPIVDEVAKELSEEAGIAKLNVDDNQKTSLKYGIRAIPTVLLFRDGVLADTHVGLVTKDDLVGLIKELL
ncbi:MAG: thioredoxin [Candidatus Methanoplasma sp.]|jgi:thioredoxin 1|nr:thioredoxin [Candidatus Methanoplasma sp.]